ncbi:alcohol dehydrogenase catalytic domain-containing protein [Sphingomonas sp. MG17]|uniref:Alcohol dehydrogenase catalytic domain-containing protein n=1 Tax=Sphingomonas tagetis TaxID=2949092 RepID=A0A9X2KNB5_9SPHN|nr:alcohol dehydrogenase catalytic domain-containing protein [Sphingomonas tagetis]MCP3732612.1 alcohol dehydrogenase catalytic domain-containing protein [Sphingomonas tagetis]
MTRSMVAARLHDLHTPMRLDTLPVPEPRLGEVLVRVKACGIVPNMGNVINNWASWFPHQPLPEFPAIFGLDPAGVVDEVGEGVIGIKPGERVYVSPLRSCGSCRPCSAGRRTECRYFTLNGYFSTSRDGQKIFDVNRYAGFGEYMLAPAYAIVKLPDDMSFEKAGRMGYLGTAYGALRNAAAGPGQVAFIDGITGTLGIASTLLCLAMGVTKILGTARNADLMARVKAFAPDRIEILTLGERSAAEWAMALTDGYGVDFVISALGARAPAATMADSMHALKRGGRLVVIGGVADEVPVNMKWLMDEQVRIIGSNWFTTEQGQDLADMVGSGVIDLNYLRDEVFPLSRVNEAISGIQERDGGFSNYVVCP